MFSNVYIPPHAKGKAAHASHRVRCSHPSSAPHTFRRFCSRNRVAMGLGFWRHVHCAEHDRGVRRQAHAQSARTGKGLIDARASGICPLTQAACYREGSVCRHAAITWELTVHPTTTHCPQKQCVYSAGVDRSVHCAAGLVGDNTSRKCVPQKTETPGHPANTAPPAHKHCYSLLTRMSNPRPFNTGRPKVPRDGGGQKFF